MLPEHLKVNEEGHLEIGGCGYRGFGRTIGTPLLCDG